MEPGVKWIGDGLELTEEKGGFLFLDPLWGLGIGDGEKIGMADCEIGTDLGGDGRSLGVESLESCSDHVFRLADVGWTLVVFCHACDDGWIPLAPPQGRSGEADHGKQDQDAWDEISFGEWHWFGKF